MDGWAMLDVQYYEYGRKGGCLFLFFFRFPFHVCTYWSLISFIHSFGFLDRPFTLNGSCSVVLLSFTSTLSWAWCGNLACFGNSHFPWRMWFEGRPRDGSNISQVTDYGDNTSRGDGKLGDLSYTDSEKSIQGEHSQGSRDKTDDVRSEPATPCLALVISESLVPVGYSWTGDSFELTAWFRGWVL
ncbi:hypothetical protein V8F33_000626 [Rhypophila sp. PSN 637]